MKKGRKRRRNKRTNESEETGNKEEIHKKK